MGISAFPFISTTIFNQIYIFTMFQFFPVKRLSSFGHIYERFCIPKLDPKMKLAVLVMLAGMFLQVGETLFRIYLLFPIGVPSLTVWQKSATPTM